MGARGVLSRRWLVTAILVMVGLWCAPVVRADETVSITATVPDLNVLPNPTIQFHGFAAPDAIVTILRGGVNVMSVVADPTGAFDVFLDEQPTGQVSYQVTAETTDHATLAPVTFALNLALGSNTIISGVFLGPSIKLDKQSVKIGQFVTVTGETVPDSAVAVTVSGLAAPMTVTADSDGHWSKMINSQDVGIGTHSVFARAVYGSVISGTSTVLAFAVNPLAQCDGKKTADLNCDGSVNLVDFSILLYFWHETTPSNARADINGDGRVDVIDFSIMLYQWTT